MNHKQLLALFLCLVIVFSPVIVSVEKEKVINVKKVDNTLDDFTIESIIENSDGYNIDIYYPVTKCAKANSVIEEKIDYYLNKFKNTDSYDELKNLDISFEKYVSGSIISFKFEVSSDVGVTHENREYFTVVYEADELITIDSLIDNNPNLLDELYLASKEQLIENDRFKQYSNLIWLDNGLKKNKNTFSNFYFYEDKIIVIFNPYVVAPFVAGSFEIEISCNLI